MGCKVVGCIIAEILLEYLHEVSNDLGTKAWSECNQVE